LFAKKRERERDHPMNKRMQCNAGEKIDCIHVALVVR